MWNHVRMRFSTNGDLKVYTAGRDEPDASRNIVMYLKRRDSLPVSSKIPMSTKVHQMYTVIGTVIGERAPGVQQFSKCRDGRRGDWS
jgi:hypothetical protein